MTERPSPARHELTWEPEAIERLTTLAKAYPEAAEDVIPAIYALARDPWPPGSAEIGGSGTYRRLLIGYFRVLYAVSEAPPTVRIVVVGRDDQPR